MDVCWGIDLGGTKTEGVILDASFNPLVRERIATEPANGYRHVIGRIVKLVDLMADKSGLALPAGIGIGTPGRIDHEQGVLKNSNTVCLNGKPLASDLEKALGIRVYLDNDANCFALAETVLGSGRTRIQGTGKTAFGIILGTGVGGGIVCGGHVLQGAHGIAGEWGHNQLIEQGDPCYCGRRGCVETVISGPALERFYSVISGRTACLEAIAQMYDEDDCARETINRLVLYFGKALAAVINILDPDMVIIGGGVGNVRQLYTTEVRESIERHLFNRRLDIPLLQPMLGDSAGVFGAALLAISVSNRGTNWKGITEKGI